MSKLSDLRFRLVINTFVLAFAAAQFAGSVVDVFLAHGEVKMFMTYAAMLAASVFGCVLSAIDYAAALTNQAKGA